MIRAVAVIVPVHDEESLLGACLASVSAAVVQLRAERPEIACSVWAVLDSCTDRSAAIAAEAGAEIVTVTARNVGRARTAGWEAARRAFADVDAAEFWTTHTDADSAVPPHWLVHQIELADAGADVIIGTVRPDFRDLDAMRTQAWWRRYTPGAANEAVHGANLGLRADVLAAAGGFPPLAEHEDVELVAAARKRGATVALSDDAWVRTSGRQTGRTPGGYARYLRDDLLSERG
ncbi:glycosyltransferase family 2 protein [Microbacterium sp. cx-59]|uniref:glycosyltransferase n=1 Tax=Microbacterium sp. cx-59 TaxID=2891207 RepID=UPI001E3A669B|nr:glycosyltransferase [Microbacterium sp. cx-59]MCC4908314.1 glycosyltransferase [Microbacterium sp. cx-59]